MNRIVTYLSFLSFSLFFSTALVAQCEIWDVTATVGDCDGNFFEVTLNFEYDGVGAEGFKVQGNGINHGNFSYGDLPITIGPLEGDGVTEYEFVVIDHQFNDCQGWTSIDPVSCGSVGCELFELTLEPGDCNPSGNYNLWINFEYENPTHTHFDVIYDGNVIGYYALADLPVLVENFEDNGENFPFIKVCINDNPDCCTSGEFEAPNCGSGDCHIYDLHAVYVECDGDQFFIKLDFEYDNVGNDGFKVKGNGNNYGTFSYNDLPIILGPLPANGTFYEFLVYDVNHPDCSDALEYGVVDCGGGNDCEIFELVVEPGDCNNDGTYPLWINFEYQNANNEFFDVYYKGEIIGTFPLAELPLAIEHFEDEGEPYPLIKVCINDQPDCCKSTEFESPDCGGGGGDCHISELFAEAHDCNNDGTYLVDIEFEAEGVGNEGFTIKANGEPYGPFEYGETFYTFGPLEDGVVYEIVIFDNQYPDCSGWLSFGPVYCDDDCHIWDLHAEVSECDDEGQFFVTLDFAFDNTGNDGFKIVGNGNVYGVFNYDDVPVTLGPFQTPVDDLEFGVLDMQFNDCGAFIEVDAPDCDGNEDCHIYDLIADVTPCQSDGTFYVFLDFEHENTSNVGFKVKGNGINYGLYGYNELPVSIGPLIGNGTMPFEFIVSDLNHPDCSDAVELGPVDCNISGDCLITDFVAAPGSCHNDGTYNLWINFEFQHATNPYFDVIYNGNVVGYFPLSSLPVVIPHFIDNGNPVQEIKVCINDMPDCCATTTYESPLCMGPDNVWPGDADYNNIANHFDLLHVGLAFGKEGPDRPVQGIEWLELESADWSSYFNNGLNHKHGDCNGDGKVTKEDLQALDVNYGQTHGDVKSPIFIGGTEDDPPFYLDLPEAGDIQLGEPFFAPIVLGSPDQPVDDLYGVAFSLLFDPELIDPASIQLSYDPSWLGVADVNLLTFDKTLAGEGRIDVSLVRSDQNDVSGHGQIMGFIGIIDNIAGKDEVTVEVINVKAIKANETLIPLNRPLEVVDLTATSTSEVLSTQIQVFPNPAFDRVQIRHTKGQPILSVELRHINGTQVLYSEQLDSSLEISDLAPGIYLLKIETEEGYWFERVVKM